MSIFLPIFRFPPSFINHVPLKELNDPEEFARLQVNLMKEAVDVVFELIMKLSHFYQIVNMSQDFPKVELMVDNMLAKGKLSRTFFC